MKTLEEYYAKSKELQKKQREEALALAKEYALSIALYKVGDIIKDSVSAIKVTKLRFDILFDEPKTVYEGVELRKDLTPRKDGSTRAIYGNDRIELIKSAN